MCSRLIPRLDPQGRPLCSISCTKEFEAQEAAKPKPKARRGRPPLTEEEKRDRRVARTLAKLSSSNPITPERMAKFRSEIAACVEEQISEAHQQVMGTADKPWSATQARVFGILMNKVLPDLHASHVKKEETAKPLNELSRDELEELAAKLAAAEAAKAKTIDAEVIPDEDH